MLLSCCVLLSFAGVWLCFSVVFFCVFLLLTIVCFCASHGCVLLGLIFGMPLLFWIRLLCCDCASIVVYCLRCASIVVFVWYVSACCPLLCVWFSYSLCVLSMVDFYCYVCLVLC